MAVLEVSERHQELVDELIEAVERVQAGARSRPARRGRSRSRRGRTTASSAAPARSSSTIPFGVAKILAELHLDEQTIAAALLHDVVEDTDADLKAIKDEFGDEIAQLVDGVTKLTRIQFQSREHAEAENYRKLIVAMAAGRPRDPDQARRPPPQPADDRVPRQAEAGAEGARGARGLRAARAPARHPRAQVGARGPRVRDAPPAQVLRDQGDGRRAARRSRGARSRGEHDPPARARQGEHPGADLRPREALLLHLRQDGEEGPRVQRDLRPDRDARAGRADRGGGDARLLRRPRPDPLALEADARPVQGLRRDAQAQPLPGAAHDGDRAAGPSARDPGADAGDARDRRVRDRGPLGVQARRQGEEGRRQSGRPG